MSTRLAFSVDLDRCIGCQACVTACRAGNETPDCETFIAISDVVRKRDGGLWGSFAHRRCFHCGTAPCVAVCPTGALAKKDGLTVVDAERCSSCAYCVEACPYQVPRVHDRRVWKCIACEDLVERGDEPWCVRTCPSGALRFGEQGAVLRDARARAATLRARYPRAQVYWNDNLDGLGLIQILLDDPAVYGLPDPARIPKVVEVWRGAVRPATAALSAATAVGMGALFVVARRRHVQEKERHDD